MLIFYRINVFWWSDISNRLPDLQLKFYKKMKEKILHILNAISLKEFGAVDSCLSDQDVIQGVVEKGGNIGFAINIGVLRSPFWFFSISICKVVVSILVVVQII